jgi:copper chaperone CopZ
MPEETINVAIEGMHCGNCVYKIECEVEDLGGVTQSKVDLDKKLGTFTFDTTSSTGSNEILKKIEELGFKATLVNPKKFLYSTFSKYSINFV